MIKLSFDGNILEARLAKSILSEKGIECIIKNDHLSGALGEIPVFDCDPEIWIIYEQDKQYAENILGAIKPDIDGPDWNCSSCHEANSSQFETCWNCDTEREK